MEAVERAAIGHLNRPLGLEHLEHRLVGLIGVRHRLGIGHTLVGQPAVEVVQRLERHARREEPLPDHADLVFDLPLFPSSRRTARPNFLSAPPTGGSTR